MTPAAEVHEVRPGDNYWTISKSAYGTGRYFMALSRYNATRISDPRKMRPGMKVLTPTPQVLESSYPELFPENAARAEGDEPSGFFMASDGRPMYRVGRNDTLGGIAHRHLGRFSRWVEIYRLNQSRLKDPNRLQLGTELALPADASRVRVVGSR
jgi:nucleoid-associated protein YgaU